MPRMEVAAKESNSLGCLLLQLLYTVSATQEQHDYKVPEEGFRRQSVKFFRIGYRPEVSEGGRLSLCGLPYGCGPHLR